MQLMQVAPALRTGFFLLQARPEAGLHQSALQVQSNEVPHIGTAWSEPLRCRPPP